MMRAVHQLLIVAQRIARIVALSCSCLFFSQVIVLSLVKFGRNSIEGDTDSDPSSRSTKFKEKNTNFFFKKRRNFHRDLHFLRNLVFFNNDNVFAT